MTDADDELRVPDSSLDFDSDLIYRCNGELFTGVAYEVADDGTMSEVRYRDGMQDGVSRDLYPDGAVKESTRFYRNERHGFERQFSLAGDLVTERLYEYGILVLSVRYGDDGGIRERYELREDSPGFSLLAKYRIELNWPPPLE